MSIQALILKWSVDQFVPGHILLRLPEDQYRRLNKSPCINKTFICYHLAYTVVNKGLFSVLIVTFPLQGSPRADVNQTICEMKICETRPTKK